MSDKPKPRKDFPKTKTFFDWSVYVTKRLEEQIWLGKYLLFGASFLLFLLYELIHFARFLLGNWLD